MPESDSTIIDFVDMNVYPWILFQLFSKSKICYYMYDINELFQTVTPYIYQSIISLLQKTQQKVLGIAIPPPEEQNSAIKTSG